MQNCRSEFLVVLRDRGFIENCTDSAGLDEAARTGTLPGYIGFDCTAPSLHAGSLVQIMMLRWLQQTGHKPIVLLGGGTTRVGDPSGKDAARQMLDTQAIAANKEGIRKVFSAFLDFGDGPTGAITVDNFEWLDRLSYVDFLQEYGRHFSVNRMLTFESVRARLDRDQPLSFLEFNYMILQAYDFLELARRHGCRLQMGGSDQWGNIVNGIDLGRRMESLRLFGITSPLLTTVSGAKMGKTAEGAIWLDRKRCSPFAFWQYWRNTDDADVVRFLRLFTEIPLSEVSRLAVLQGEEINDAKIILANEATALVHGRKASERASIAARQAFGAGATDEHALFKEDSHGLSTVELSPGQIGDGIAVAKLFVQSGLASSGKDAKRLFKNGGAKLQGETILDPNRTVSVKDLSDGSLRISAGRKRHALIRLR